MEAKFWEMKRFHLLLRALLLTLSYENKDCHIDFCTKRFLLFYLHMLFYGCQAAVRIDS